MKKFRVIFTDAQTGYDLYVNFVVEAPKMSDVATHLEHLPVNFRLIEVVIGLYPPSFVCNSWDTIPAQAFDNCKN